MAISVPPLLASYAHQASSWTHQSTLQYASPASLLAPHAPRACLVRLVLLAMALVAPPHLAKSVCQALSWTLRSCLPYAAHAYHLVLPALPAQPV